MNCPMIEETEGMPLKQVGKMIQAEKKNLNGKKKKIQLSFNTQNTTFFPGLALSYSEVFNRHNHEGVRPEVSETDV